MTKTEESSPKPIDFTALILGFSTAALGYLGLSPVDGENMPQKNIGLAKQNIDIIALLKEKTKGNLSPEEETLTDQLLADLQLKYVEANRSEK